MNRSHRRRRISVRAALLFGWVALPFPGLHALAAAPSIKVVDLFHAGEGGYAFYRIPGLVVTAQGVVLAYCEARREGRSDWEDIDVLLRRSTDGGLTWEAPRKLAEVAGPHRKNPVALAGKYAAPEQVTYSNPVAIASRDGSVHFLFCLEFNRCFYMRSDDDGATFSPPFEITSAFDAFRPAYDWRVIATGPGHGIELQNGRLLVPVWMSTGKGSGGFHPSVVGLIYSDGRGLGWLAGDIALPGAADGPNPTCGEALELADGRVVLNARSESRSNRRLVTIGTNGATGWNSPYFDPALLEPGCMGSLIRLSKKPVDDRNRILFSNPDNLRRRDGKEGPGRPRDRVNLSLKLSYDEGVTWPVNKTLDPGVSAYSDLAVLPDGTILCLYERGAVGTNSHQTAFLSLARFGLDWLTDGKDHRKRPHSDPGAH